MFSGSIAIRHRMYLVLVAGALLTGCGEPGDQTRGANRAPTVAADQEPDLATQRRWDGAKIYDEVCDKCHKMGVDGAPELGEAEAWAPRIAKGTEVLFNHVKEGFNKMPPRGECAFCTDTQLHAAMHYMIANSR